MSQRINMNETLKAVLAGGNPPVSNSPFKFTFTIPPLAEARLHANTHHPISINKQTNPSVLKRPILTPIPVPAIPTTVASNRAGAGPARRRSSGEDPSYQPGTTHPTTLQCDRPRTRASNKNKSFAQFFYPLEAPEDVGLEEEEGEDSEQGFEGIERRTCKTSGNEDSARGTEEDLHMESTGEEGRGDGGGFGRFICHFGIIFIFISSIQIAPSKPIPMAPKYRQTFQENLRYRPSVLMHLRQFPGPLRGGSNCFVFPNGWDEARKGTDEELLKWYLGPKYRPRGESVLVQEATPKQVVGMPDGEIPELEPKVVTRGGGGAKGRKNRMGKTKKFVWGRV